MSAGQQPLLIGTYTEELPHVDGHAVGILAAAYGAGRLTDSMSGQDARRAPLMAR